MRRPWRRFVASSLRRFVACRRVTTFAEGNSHSSVRGLGPSTSSSTSRVATRSRRGSRSASAHSTAPCGSGTRRGSLRPGSHRRLSAAPVGCGLQHDRLAHDRILAVEVVEGFWYLNNLRLLARRRKRPRGARPVHRQPCQANPLNTPLIGSRRPLSARSITGFRGR
jgi:hypothetical protein